MIIDCTQVLKDLSGKPIINGDLQENESLILGKAISSVLIAPRQNSNLDTFRAWVLAQKFYTSESVEVDKETKKFIKQALDTFPSYNPLVTGQIKDMIEEKEDKKDE